MKKNLILSTVMVASLWGCQKDEELPSVSKAKVSEGETLFLAPNVAGEFYNSTFINKAHDNFVKYNKELATSMLISANNEERKGEYFSREMLEELLKLKDMKGVVIKYGLVYEDADNKVVNDFGSEQDYKNLKMRLFVVPYDKHDKTIAFPVKNARLNGEELGGAANGKPIPPYGQ